MAKSICSAQSKNRYDSGIVPAQSRNPTLSADSGIVPDNSRIAQGIYIVLSSGIISAQSRSRVGQSRNLMGSAIFSRQQKKHTLFNIHVAFEDVSIL